MFQSETRKNTCFNNKKTVETWEKFSNHWAVKYQILLAMILCSYRRRRPFVFGWAKFERCFTAMPFHCGNKKLVSNCCVWLLRSFPISRRKSRLLRAGVIFRANFFENALWELRVVFKLLLFVILCIEGMNLAKTLKLSRQLIVPWIQMKARSFQWLFLSLKISEVTLVIFVNIRRFKIMWSIL